MKFKIKRGDVVKVITGKDRGREGKVVAVLRKKAKVIVEGVNMVKRHVKAQQTRNQKGGIIEKEMPIHISNVKKVASAE